MLKSLPTSNNCSVLWVSEVTAHFWGLCHTTGRSNCTWDRELWQYWTFVNYKYLHLHFPQQGTCHAGFSGKTMNATIHHKRHLLTCAPGAELLSYTRGIPAMQYPAPWFNGSARREHTPKPGLSPALLLFWLALCSLKLFRSLPQASASSDCIWFGSLPFKHFRALAGSWGSLQEGAAPASPQGSANTPARSPCTEWKHPRSPATGKHFSSWTWRERREARQRNWEKRSQDTNPTTHRSYTSHSPTPFGQTNLKTRSLTRLSLRTSLDHWQLSPIHSVIFILCKQGCVELFFLFFSQR